MSAIHLTVLPLDTPTARTLARRNDLEGGTVVVTVRPDTRRAGWIARDLLAAVGIRHDASGVGRRDSDDRQLAATWLAAHEVDDVIVIGVEALPEGLIDELVDVTSLADAALWLVADHTLPERLTDTLADWPVMPCPPNEFRDRWLTATAVDGPGNVTDELPFEVPQVDFTTFRASCRYLLNPERFAEADRRYRQQMVAAAARLDAGVDAIEVVRDAVECSRSRAATTVAVRAVQAAAFVRGIHVKVDLAALLAHDDHVPAATAARPNSWTALRAYRQPHRQAVCMLSMVGLAPTDIQTVTLADLDQDLAVISFGGRSWQIPDQARPMFRALRSTRRAAAAGRGDVLVADLDGTPVTERAIARFVATVPRELGFRIDVGQVERTRAATASWARRRGIHTARLDR